MKLFVSGFWYGFLDKTDPVHYDFFIKLFEKVFQQSIEISNNIDECELLLESIFSSDTRLFDKEWKYTFMFHGESECNVTSRLGHNMDRLSKYNCVLCGERNNLNIVNVPLYVPYLYCNNLIDRLQSNQMVCEKPRPSKNICAIISNPNAPIRNRFLERLEKLIPIDYAGSYKNNMPRIGGPYNSSELTDFISQYKFIVSMENSRDDTYITEKIINGFSAGIVPIYWGCERVHDYFNADRFLSLDANPNMDEDALNSSIDTLVSKIVLLLSDDNAYDAMIKTNIFVKTLGSDIAENPRNMDTIVRDIRSVIFPKSWPMISKTYIIASPIFEQARYEKIVKTFSNIGMLEQDIQFICPTYKQTITNEIYAQWVKFNYCPGYHRGPMLKTELSLFLNHITVLEHIVQNYSDGMFLVFESDVLLMDTISQFNDFLEMVGSKRKDGLGSDYSWDLISIGVPYSEHIYRDWWKEDLTKEGDKFRLIQKNFTKCTDSLLWSYSGAKKMLDLLKVENNYCLPIDAFIDDFILKKYPEFKCYWSSVSFFEQETFCRGGKSTIR